jgi:dTMP kinase
VNARAGTLLVFEGLDGSGKTTQRALLAARLRSAGHDVVETAEPYDGGTWGPKIRAMARSGTALAPEEELRWFVEQRREHVRERIAPALAAGRVVLSDRYFFSTAAYQGARGLDAEAILAANEREFPIPALVLLLEIDPAAGLARVGTRGAAAEPVFEKRDFLERVAANFAKLERPYVARIPASRPAEAVAEEVAALVRERAALDVGHLAGAK